MNVIEYYVRCFDRDMVVELKNSADREQAEIIMEKAYLDWQDDPCDMCCEEYIFSALTEGGIECKWIEGDVSEEYPVK